MATQAAHPSPSFYHSSWSFLWGISETSWRDLGLQWNHYAKLHSHDYRI